MILAFDIGNSNVVFGVMRASDGEVLSTFRLQADPLKTTDEYATLLFSLMQLGKIDLASVRAVVISSVVPPLTFTFTRVVSKYFNMEPIVLNTDSDHGLDIKLDNPRALGTDRLMTAVAAYYSYHTNCITVDYGTATTIEAITERGEFLGGIIFPGIKLSAEALHLRTAQLPQVELMRPDKAIGTNTIESIQSGLFYGYVDLVDGLVERFIKERFQGKPLQMLATGGLGSAFARESRHHMRYEPNLILHGLYIMYQRTQSS
ncbi:MAG: type III pantothenate kinase [Deferribacteraceae bacterium]|jgi:type III pantothenate kinase|nr:type III pantothenate kinase [Deferribacteraceae bacterium]